MLIGLSYTVTDWRAIADLLEREQSFCEFDLPERIRQAAHRHERSRYGRAPLEVRPADVAAIQHASRAAHRDHSEPVIAIPTVAPSTKWQLG